MKKVLILIAVLILCGMAYGEEGKVFTDDDLKKYKSGDNSSVVNESKKSPGYDILDELKKEGEVCRDNYNSWVAYSVSLEKLKTITTVIENSNIDSIYKLRLLEFAKSSRGICETGMKLRDAERDLQRRR